MNGDGTDENEAGFAVEVLLTDDPPPCLHFIGFRGEEYWSAVKVWGKPEMIHRV
jgi:hypothetical protein